MQFYLEIETFDKKLSYDLFETKSLPAEPKSISDGVTIKYDRLEFKKAIGFPDIIHIVVEIIKDVGIGLFSAWLYDKLKGRATKIKINFREIEVDEEQIEELLEEMMDD